MSREASALGESPVWDLCTQALLWVDITGRQLHCLHAPSGEEHSWPLPEEPGCIALVAGVPPTTARVGPYPGERTGSQRADGPRFPREVVIALRSGFHLFDLSTGSLSRLSAPLFDTTRYRFNDGAVDPRGRFWAGSLFEPKTQASAGLYCLERGRARVVTGAGAAASPWRDWGVRTSNGLAFSPDGRTMYHSDTPAHRVYAYDYDAVTGSIANRRTWWQADDDRTARDYGGRPDGAAVDVQGCYWTAQYEGGRVLQLSPDGRILRELGVPARCPTMVAFGGADLATLYVSSARAGRSAQELQEWPLSGFVFAIPVDVAGLPANRYVK